MRKRNSNFKATQQLFFRHWKLSFKLQLSTDHHRHHSRRRWCLCVSEQNFKCFWKKLNWRFQRFEKTFLLSQNKKKSLPREHGFMFRKGCLFTIIRSMVDQFWHLFVRLMYRQCDQIGRFFNFLGKKFLSKVAQRFGQMFGLF